MIYKENNIEVSYPQNLISVFQKESVEYSEGLNKQFLILKASKRKSNFYRQKYKISGDIYYIINVKYLDKIDVYSAIEVVNKRELNIGEKNYVYLKYTFLITFSEGYVMSQSDLKYCLDELKEKYSSETPELTLEQYHLSFSDKKEEAKKKYCENMNVEYER